MAVLVAGVVVVRALGGDGALAVCDREAISAGRSGTGRVSAGVRDSQGRESDDASRRCTLDARAGPVAMARRIFRRASTIFVGGPPEFRRTGFQSPSTRPHRPGRFRRSLGGRIQGSARRCVEIFMTEGYVISGISVNETCTQGMGTMPVSLPNEGRNSESPEYYGATDPVIVSPQGTARSIAKTTSKKQRGHNPRTCRGTNALDQTRERVVGRRGPRSVAGPFWSAAACRRFRLDGRNIKNAPKTKAAASRRTPNGRKRHRPHPHRMGVLCV